jgi:hypothetical protein
MSVLLKGILIGLGLAVVIRWIKLQREKKNHPSRAEWLRFERGEMTTAEADAFVARNYSDHRGGDVKPLT